MAETTGIAWCDATWNPWTGCTKVSAGCDHCYMYRQKARWGHDGSKVVRSAAKTFNLPLAKKKDGSWKIPSGSFVFVCSWSDFFHQDVPVEWRDEAMAMMCLRPRVTFLLLTKRPERMAAYYSDLVGRARGCWHGIPGFLAGQLDDTSAVKKGWEELWKGDEQRLGPRDPDKLGDWSLAPVSNIWLGVTAENQAMADERIPALLDIDWPGKKFVSVEPMLGPVTFRWKGCAWGLCGPRDPEWHLDALKALDWVICGGESGPNNREINADWVRGLRDQCIEANVPFFLKQYSAVRPAHMPKLDGKVWGEMPQA